MGNKLLMLTAFHPQTDGATEWANRLIGQVLRVIVCNDQKNWKQHCPLAEFALNSNISSTTGYAPFKLNCGFMPQLGQRLSTNTKFAGVQQFMQQARWNLMMAHDAIIESRIVQLHHTNHQRALGVKYSPGDFIYLSTKNLTLPKGRAKKLQPKYIGLYKVVEVHTVALTVKLELPPESTAQRVHPTFHVSLIQAHIPNNDERFPRHDTATCYDF